MREARDGDLLGPSFSLLVTRHLPIAVFGRGVDM